MPLLPIDRDIPAPAGDGRKAHNDKGISRTLRRLKPGESFLIPGKDSTYASRLIYREKKRRPGADFVSRTREGGVRIWCLADPAAELFS